MGLLQVGFFKFYFLYFSYRVQQSREDMSIFPFNDQPTLITKPLFSNFNLRSASINIPEN